MKMKRRRFKIYIDPTPPPSFSSPKEYCVDTARGRRCYSEIRVLPNGAMVGIMHDGRAEVIVGGSDRGITPLFA